MKLLVRREETHGHLPICWGVLTAALGLSTGASERCRAPSMLSHPCVLHATYPSYRAEPISPFVLAGAKSSVILCPSQHNRTIRCSTATPARCAAPGRYRNGTVQVPLNSPICRSGLEARRRGRHPRTRYDLAPWGDPRCPPRSTAFTHFQQLGSTRACPLWIHSIQIPTIYDTTTMKPSPVRGARIPPLVTLRG